MNAESELGELRAGQLRLEQAIYALDDKIDILAKGIAELLELLTPEEKPQPQGPTLHELLGHLISVIEQQNIHLKDVCDSVALLVDATRHDREVRASNGGMSP